MASTLPFPILIPRELGEVRWTAKVLCESQATFRQALDRYCVPIEERFDGLFARTEIAIEFANVTLILVNLNSLPTAAS